MRIVKSVSLLILIIALVVFTIQNLQTVTFTFIVWHLEIPLSIVSVLLYILGAISGGLLFSLVRRLSSEINSHGNDNLFS
jgi:uncharacterized integral membrane protein